MWQKRYYDHNVRNYASFVEKLRYLHRNPVKRGLAEKSEDWKWSSFRHYATAEMGPVEIESQWTLTAGMEELPNCYGFAPGESRDPHLPKSGRCGAPSAKTIQTWATGQGI